MILLFILITGTISGKVFDFHTHKPLKAVSILLEGTPYGTLSSDSGEFLLKGIPEGKYTLSASRVGYETYSLNIKVIPDSSIRLEIGLIPKPIPLKPVEVRGERPVSPNFLTSTRDELKRIPGAEKDIFRAIQSFPGVGMTSDYWGRLYIRGGNPEENLYLLDGIEIFNPYHFYGFTSIFNPDLIKGIRFSPGGFDARYGNRLSSVLEITTRSIKGLPEGKLNLDPIEMGGIFSSPILKGSSFILSGRKSYIDRYIEKFNIQEGFILPHYYDIQGKGEWKIFKNSSLSLSGLRSKGDAKAYATFESEEGRLNWKSTSNALGLNLLIRCHKVSSSTQIFLTQGKSDFSIKESNKNWYRKSDISKEGCRENLKIEPFSDLIVEIGGEASWLDYFYHSTIPEEILHFEEWERELSADTTSWILGGYGIAHYKLSSRLMVDMGMRGDYLGITKEKRFSPRLSLVYSLNSKVRIHLSWGFYSQFPGFEYLQSYPFPKSSIAKHYIAELETPIFKGLEAKISIYDKELSDLIVMEEERFKNRGWGFSRGIELTLRKRLSKGWFGWLSYSYSISRRSYLLEDRPLPADGDQPHILNLVTGINLPLGLYFSMKFRFASGAPYTPVIGKSWDGEEWEGKLGGHNSLRLPLYKRLDVRLEKGVGMGNIYLSILNLLGDRNLQYYIYSLDATKRRPLYMMPRLPLLGIELNF